MLGLGGGLFIVPIVSVLQHRPSPQTKGAVQGAASWLSWVGIAAAAITQTLLSGPAHLSYGQIFWVCGAVAALGGHLRHLVPAAAPCRTCSPAGRNASPEVRILTPSCKASSSTNPTRFIPPRFSRFWHWVVRRLLPRYLRKNDGITAVECIGAEKLRASLDAGHGIMIVANHCRPCDPMVLDSLAAAVHRPFHVIASWHVFMTSKIQRFLLPRMGGFSVYREGMDRESLKCAIKIVADGKHPLVIFAEGIITRCNDRLVNFMEGPAFMARAAAKQRKEGKVVIHPVFIRYFFEGDLQEIRHPGRRGNRTPPLLAAADPAAAARTHPQDRRSVAGAQGNRVFPSPAAGDFPRTAAAAGSIICSRRWKTGGRPAATTAIRWPA